MDMQHCGVDERGIGYREVPIIQIIKSNFIVQFMGWDSLAREQ